MGALYELTNKDEGPRYLFTVHGATVIVQPGETSAPSEIAEGEIAAARAQVSPTTEKPVWDIKQVGQADDGTDGGASDGNAKPLSKMTVAELRGQIELRKADGMDFNVADNATRAEMIDAIETADRMKADGQQQDPPAS